MPCFHLLRPHAFFNLTERCKRRAGDGRQRPLSNNSSGICGEVRLCFWSPLQLVTPSSVMYAWTVNKWQQMITSMLSVKGWGERRWRTAEMGEWTQRVYLLGVKSCWCGGCRRVRTQSHTAGLGRYNVARREPPHLTLRWLRHSREGAHTHTHTRTWLVYKGLHAHSYTHIQSLIYILYSLFHFCLCENKIVIVCKVIFCFVSAVVKEETRNNSSWFNLCEIWVKGKFTPNVEISKNFILPTIFFSQTIFKLYNSILYLGGVLKLTKHFTLTLIVSAQGQRWPWKTKYEETISSNISYERARRGLYKTLFL